MGVQRVTWRQLLLDPAGDVVEAAGRLGGIHAQVASCSRLIAAARSPAPPDLDAALWTDRRLVRTWAARGTLHLLPAAELDLWVGALTDRDARRRFLSANGPATAADVARWWGEQPSPAKRWIRDDADALAAVEIDREAGFVVRAEDVDELAATPDGGTDPADAPLLLPGFDPWVIAPLSHRRRAIPEGRESEVSRAAGWISPVLVVGGRVAGVGEQAETITVRPFAPLRAATRRAVERGRASTGHLGLTRPRRPHHLLADRTTSSQEPRTLRSAHSPCADAA